jgi:hypothetical protein
VKKRVGYLDAQDLPPMQRISEETVYGHILSAVPYGYDDCEEDDREEICHQICASRCREVQRQRHDDLVEDRVHQPDVLGNLG